MAVVAGVADALTDGVPEALVDVVAVGVSVALVAELADGVVAVPVAELADGVVVAPVDELALDVAVAVGVSVVELVVPWEAGAAKARLKARHDVIAAVAVAVAR